MTVIHILESLSLGCIAGLIYGFLFTRKITLPIQGNFLSSFFMASLRIIAIAFLWNYVLRRTALNIILVLISFLASFWTIVIKKKVLHE